MQGDDNKQRQRRRFLKLLGLSGIGAGLGGSESLLRQAVAAGDRGRDGLSTDDILKRTIPASGEQIPAVGLGTARTMDVGSVESLSETRLAELRDVLRLFHDHGARLVDTSPMYGTAEEIVGHLARDLGITDKMFMATKVWTQGREKGEEQMQRSMELLHSEPMDLMQIHNLVDWRTHYKTLREWKDTGHVRYIGVTHYRSDVHEELERVLTSETFDFVQFNYNVLDRNAEKRLLPLCQDKGIAVLINEPFEKGNLFHLTRGKEVPAWAGEFDADSWAQVFLKFILAHPAVTCPIPATSDPEHVVDNVMAAYGKLPDAGQRDRIIKYLENA